MNTIIGIGVGGLVLTGYFVVRHSPDDLVKASDIVYAVASAYIAGVVVVAILRIWGVS